MNTLSLIHIYIIDPDTGEITDAWIFVGVLTYSQYAFVKAYMNEKTNNWIKAHVQMFDFFGGVTPMLVYDSLRLYSYQKRA